MRGVVIAGTSSGSGKTTVSSAIMEALSKRYTVQPYKVGPDFIDPMYHTAITSRQSRNLDTFMAGKGRVRRIVGNASADADISIVEGVRGLFEGLSGSTDDGSTAETAKLLGFPVILVVDARSLTRSAVAMINGFAAFDPDVRVAGVIFNNVSGPQHASKLRDAVSRYGSVRIVGMVGLHKSAEIGTRHLGLAIPSERGWAGGLGCISDDIDLDAVIEIAESAGDIQSGEPQYTERDTGLKVAVPYDDSYCFYYPENLECLEASGCRIERFSPQRGDPLPDADICYLGGGYPELHACDISENRDFLEGLKNMSDEGCPVIGECGGLMTMCRGIVDQDGNDWPMSGIFDASVRMSGRHGPKYTVSTASDRNPLFSGTVRGHEFHYSELVIGNDCEFGFSMSRGAGICDGSDGLFVNNSIGTYSHAYALSVPDWVGKITAKAGL